MDNPKSPRNKVEAAFARYVESAAHPALADMNHYPSQSSEKKRLPCAVYYVEEAQEITPESGVYEGGLFIYVLTQADDETAGIHDERLAAINELLSDSAAVKAAVNFGAPGPRPVQGFHLYGFFEARAKDDMKGRHFGEALYYEVRFAKFDKR